MAQCFSHGPDGLWQDPEGLYVEFSDYEQLQGELEAARKGEVERFKQLRDELLGEGAARVIVARLEQYGWLQGWFEAEDEPRLFADVRRSLAVVWNLATGHSFDLPADQNPDQGDARKAACRECGREECPWHMPDIDALLRAAEDIEVLSEVGTKEWAELLLELLAAGFEINPCSPSPPSPSSSDGSSGSGSSSTGLTLPSAEPASRRSRASSSSVESPGCSASVRQPSDVEGEAGDSVGADDALHQAAVDVDVLYDAGLKEWAELVRELRERGWRLSRSTQPDVEEPPTCSTCKQGLQGLVKDRQDAFKEAAQLAREQLLGDSGVEG